MLLVVYTLLFTFIAVFDCILGETIVRNNSVDHAVDYRDGMAKVCQVVEQMHRA